MLKDFKPALLFLAKFLGVYLAGNILYGIYIESHGDHPDHATALVGKQTVVLLNACGAETTSQLNPTGPTVFIQTPGEIVLSVFEGCNGLNVMIIFIAFVVAFGGPIRHIAWYIPVGLLVIHIFNLLRIALLFFVAQHYENYFYYVHKYIFTAIIYAVVFALWAFWIMKFHVRSRKASEEV